MKNEINYITTFVIGLKLLSCKFSKITNTGINIRADLGDGPVMISEPPTTEKATLPCEYAGRFCEFFNELKNRITMNLMNDPSKSCFLNAWLALKDMNIKLRRKVEEFTFNDLEKIIVEIFFEGELLAYTPLSSVINYTDSSFTSTTDELMNFLREEIR